MVAPRGGAGIEIEEKTECGMTLLVAPRGEAGIEILNGIHSVTSGLLVGAIIGMSYAPAHSDGEGNHLERFS